MRKLVAAAAVALLCGSALAQAVYVQPKFRADGTFQPGHYRTAPNDTVLDNYSTKGNYNPYTGKAGTVDPYRQPQVEQLRQPELYRQKPVRGF